MTEERLHFRLYHLLSNFVYNTMFHCIGTRLSSGSFSDFTIIIKTWWLHVRWESILCWLRISLHHGHECPQTGWRDSFETLPRETTLDLPGAKLHLRAMAHPSAFNLMFAFMLCQHGLLPSWFGFHGWVIAWNGWWHLICCSFTVSCDDWNDPKNNERCQLTLNSTSPIVV